MNYKGFTIIRDIIGWKVRVTISEEWLCTSEEDARQQVNEYLTRKARRAAA